MTKSFKLAQFPLELIVFPGEKLPLHIFEPRYIDLVKDCLRLQQNFGIAPVIEGKLQSVGTIMRLISSSKEYDDGRLDIIAQGSDRYTIETFYEKTKETTYGMADVLLIQDQGSPDPIEQVKIKDLVDEMFGLMRIPKKLAFDIHDDPFILGHKIGLTMEEEFHLLSILDSPGRQAYILQKLARVIPKIKELDQIRRQIEMNGHFRHIIPPKL